MPLLQAVERGERVVLGANTEHEDDEAIPGLLIVLRRMQIKSDKPWLSRLLSPEEGAPYAVAIAIGALLAAPASPVLAAGMAGIAA